MEMKYSEQAKIMLDNLKEFDKLEFEKWFMDNLLIGSNNILQFLIEKNKKKIIIPKMEVK